MSVLSSELWCHFLTKSRNLQVTEVELYSIQIFVLGGKIKQNRKRTWDKIICSLAIACSKWMPRDTADSGWAFHDVSYRVRYHDWLVALRGKSSDVARWGMIAFWRRKGALQNVNMLTVSKSGRSYILGKPLSSHLRHIIIDKIHRLQFRKFGKNYCMFSTLWIPVSTASEANPKTPILMLLAPLSNKPFIYLRAEILSGQIYLVDSFIFLCCKSQWIHPPEMGTSFTMRSTNLLYSRHISSFSTIYTGVILFVE